MICEFLKRGDAILELENEIRILESFGLTLNEARVFLALTLLGTASVKEISKSSNVAREAVYRVLPRLQKLGLVEKEITWPTRFIALTLDDAVTVLLALRNRETCDLQEKAKVLLSLKNKKAKMEPLEDSKFLLIPAKKMLISKIGDQLDRAQKSVSVVTSKKRLRGAMDIFSAAIEKASSRGVKFRIVTSNTKRVLSPAILEVCNNNPCIEIRYTFSDPKCAALIFDKKEVLIITKPAAEVCCESSALWSNNSSLVNIVEEYFEILWITASEKPEYSTNDDQI
jgi:sugar-specific transcriptional regulator TrmB